MRTVGFCTVEKGIEKDDIDVILEKDNMTVSSYVKSRKVALVSLFLLLSALGMASNETVFADDYFETRDNGGGDWYPGGNWSWDYQWWNDTWNYSYQGYPGWNDTWNFTYDHPQWNDTWNYSNLFGHFNYTDGKVSGVYVEFCINESTGLITNYVLKRNAENITLFKSIAIGNFTSSTKPVVYGPLFVHYGKNMVLVAHDNPSAVLNHVAVNKTNSVEYTLGENISATEVTGDWNFSYFNRHVVRIEGDNLTAWLIVSHGDVAVDGSTVSADLDDFAQAMLWVMPMQGYGHGITRDAIAYGTRNGIIGAEISITLQDGKLVQDIVTHLYGMEVNVLSAVENKAKVSVSAELETGQVIIINTDRSVLPTESENEIDVDVDGKSIQQTDNPDEVFNPIDNGAKYFATVNDNGAIQILVFVPHFSVHTISIKGFVEDIGGLNVFVPLIAGVAVTVGAFSLLAYSGKRREV